MKHRFTDYARLLLNTHTTMVRSFLEATANRFDWFFYARVHNQVVPSHMRAFRLFFLAYKHFWPFLSIIVVFGNRKVKLEKSGDWKWWSFKWFINPRLIILTHINQLRWCCCSIGSECTNWFIIMSFNTRPYEWKTPLFHVYIVRAGENELLWRGEQN